MFMKPNPAKILLTCIAVVLLLAGMVSANAAVAVVSGTTVTATYAAGSGTSQTFSSYDMKGGNCLVVVVSGKVTGTYATPTSVTMGGNTISMTSLTAVSTASGASILYAINPTTTKGDLVVTFASALGGGGVTVMSLSGVASAGGAGETATVSTTARGTYNPTVTGTANGMVVLSGTDALSTTPNFAGTPTLTATIKGNFGTSVGHGYAAIASSGATADTYATSSTSGSATRVAIAQMAFDPAATTYAVTYNANYPAGSSGQSGTVPTDSYAYVSGQTATAANNSGSLAASSYNFAGWNTAANGSGTAIAASGTATFTVTANTTLYAQWSAISASITTSGSLSAFSTTYGTASANQSFTVSGANISGGILVTAPAGFEVSQTSGSGYGSTTTVSGSGTIASTSIYVRLAGATVAGTYSTTNVACTSSGAVEQDVVIPSSSVGNATLTITSPTASSKTFDGTATATVGGTLSASQNGDSLTLTGSFPSSAPGTGLTVTYGVTGTHSSSYTVTQPSVTANIAGTSITLNAADASGTSSFNGSTNWSIVAAPVAGNTYAAAFNLRTPTSGNNSFAGDSLTIQTNGGLAVKSAASATLTANNLILNGGNIAQSDQSTISGGTMGLAGNITASANATISASRISGTTDTLNITAPISGGSGVTLTIGNGATTGVVRLSGINTFNGTITVSATDYVSTGGVLQLNNLNAVQNATLNLATSMSGVAGMTFNSTANTGTFNIGALAGSTTATTFALKDTASAAVAISVGANNAFTTYAGIITDIGSLTKVGTGTLTLSGANTYGGSTTISGGTLQVDGASGAINSSSGITINGSGAKYLHTASTASTETITETLGTVDGASTLGTVNVANNSANIVQNGNGGTASLTIGTLAFSGAATLNVAQSGTAGTSGINVTGALTTTPGSGTVTIHATIAGGTWSSGTTYNLVHSGSGSLPVSDFTKGTITALTGRQSASLVQVDANTIGLQITGDAPKWSGLDSADWVVGATGSSGNWKLITGGTATDYIQGDSVTFDDSATVAHNAVSISAANVSPTATIFNNSSVSYTVGGSFGIAAGSLAVNGGGTVNLNTLNTYSGSTTVSSSSTLNLGGSLGSTVISVGSGSTLAESSGGVIGGSASIANSGTASLAGANNYSGGTTLSAGQLNINNGGDATHSAIGTGPLTISGGTIDNTSSGDVTVSPAIGQNWNGDFTYAGSAHNLNLGNGAVTLGANRQVTVSANTLTVGGAIGGSFGLTKNGNGTLTLAGVNTYSGKTIMNAGTVSIGAESGIGATPGSTVADQLTLDGGALKTTGSISLNAKRGITIGAVNGGTINVDSGTTLTYNYLLAGGALTKGGAGTLTLAYGTSDHTYSGLVLNDGTLIMGKSSALGAGVVLINGGRIGNNSVNTTRTPTNAVILNGDLAIGVASTDGAFVFTGPWTLTNSSHSITVDTANSVTISGAIGENGGSYGLTKAGSGLLILSGSNAYTGTTTVNHGTLRVSGSISTGPVTVNGGSLTGAGTNSGAVTVNSGGTLAPGTSTIGTLTLGSTLSLAGNANFRINKSGATLTSDQVVGATSITAGGTLTVISNANSSAFVANNSFTLFNSGMGSSWFSSVSLPPLGTGLTWNTNGLATSGVLAVYTFTTTPLLMSTPVGTSATISSNKLATHASSGLGIALAKFVSAPANGGSAVLNTDGSLTYTPAGAANVNGGTDSFIVTFGDGNGIQMLAVTVTVGTGDGSTSPNLLGQVTDGGNYIMQFAGYPGIAYTIETNTVVGPGWGKLQNVTAPTDGIISVTNIMGTNSLFFRTVWPSY